MLIENTKLLKYLSSTPHIGATFISKQGFYIWAKNVDHPGLIDLLDYEDEDEESIIDSKGWIRCDSGLSFSVNNLPASFIELPEKEITTEQYEALLNWMIKCCNGEEFQISCTNGDFKEYDMEVYWPEDLIKIIKHYYKTGILKESVLTYNNLTEKIVKLGSKWQVQSEKGRNMGTYDTKEEAEKRLKQIEYFKHTNEELLEDTRTTLVTKSRNQGQYKDTSRGKNRFERKKYSKVASAVKAFNQIDMNDLFKQDILTIKIPVTGETDSYTVSIKMEGVVSEIAKNVKNNKNKFEFRTTIQALTKIFNTANIYVNCTCKDYCLHPDTKIKLLNGTTVTVKELESIVNSSDKPIYLYSVDTKGDFKPGKIKKVWVSAWVNEMIEITLDNGKTIVTTLDHPYMLRNGTYTAAENLQVGQSLMPLYFGKTANGYETVKANSIATTEFFSTYKQVANALLQDEIEEAIKYFNLNHKINSIKIIKYDMLQPVYDIAVEDYHNFYVDAGVILHNCYNFDHWNIINNVSTSDTAHDPGPGKNIRNPQDNKGRGCKHVLLVLNNGDWMMKVASVINNYVHYAETNMQKAFLKLIFPKIYGIPADEMLEQDLVDDEKFLDSSAGLIDAINEYGAKRGRYTKGTNKNPVTGTGGRTKKEPETETDTEKKESK